MAEDLVILKTTNKEEQYLSLVPQIHALVEGEDNLIANLANIAAALKEQFGWLWIGFYLESDGELVLGPFQGPVACTRIKPGKGVCGQSWADNKVLIVPDVDAFPGHIACSSASRSEIVIPVSAAGKLIGVLDADSAELDQFDEIDAKYLKEIMSVL